METQIGFSLHVSSFNDIIESLNLKNFISCQTEQIILKNKSIQKCFSSFLANTKFFGIIFHEVLTWFSNKFQLLSFKLL